MAHHQYFGSKTDLFFYYRSTGKTHIHLIEESIDGRLTASQLMAPVTEPMKMGRIHVLPWEKICL
jgi:hypothetical protein